MRAVKLRTCFGTNRRFRPGFRNTCNSRFRSQAPRSQRVPQTPRTCFEGPFGEVIRAPGPIATANPFRVSTKYQDDETDLLYYGYRYYNASTGRWISRDLIEEDGGLDLYAFVENDTVSNYDLLGHKTDTLTVLGAKWKFKAHHVSAPGKKKRGKEIGRTTFFIFPWDVYITGKGCPQGQRQLRANPTTYTVEYWYTDKDSKAYEEGNVSVVREYWQAYAGNVNGLAGCFCDSCADIRLDLSKLYAALGYYSAKRDDFAREVTIQHLPLEDEYSKAAAIADEAQKRIESKQMELSKCVLDKR